MSDLDQGREILETMLGALGFVVEIDAAQTATGPCLQVKTSESRALIGDEGERLDDLQYLLNRLVHARNEFAPRIRVDVEHHREIREDALIEEARKLAEGVKETGHPAKLRPLNSYFRRVVHNAFIDDPDILTWSPPDSARVKRVTLMLRPRKEGGIPRESG